MIHRPGNKISFSTPADWELVENDSMLVLFNHQSNDGNFFSITTNEKSEAIGNAESYFNLLVNELRKDNLEIINASAYKNTLRSIFQVDVVSNSEEERTFCILITESDGHIFDFTMAFTKDREFGRAIFLTIMASCFFDDSSLIGYDANLTQIEISTLRDNN